jgi:hypothetical protein
VRVRYRDVLHSQGRRARFKINLDGIFRGGDYPEETVCSDARTIVMDLYQWVRDAYRTGGINIESNEDERSMMVFSVLSDILALHRSHICAKRDWRA